MPIDLSPDHLVVRPLTAADVDACVVLENAAFTNPHHRASRAKFQYRLDVCPEVCWGVAAGEGPDAQLVAHIVATRCPGGVVTDDSMGLPGVEGEKTEEEKTEEKNKKIGHQPGTPTVAVHSLAVLPEAQGHGLGSKLMQAYLKEMASLDGTERVALICQDYLVPFYKKQGFALVGPSAAQFGGGGWFDMVYELKK